MATKPSTLCWGHQGEGNKKVLRQLHALDREKAAPDAAAALTFRILEHGCGKVAALDRGEGFRQPVHPGHWDLQPGLLGGLQAPRIMSSLFATMKS